MSVNSLGSGPLGGISANAASAGGAGGAGSAGIGDQFMKMLVAQLKNQDPLNPMDPTAMTAQLTQLNSLQQLESINGALGKMTGAGGSLGSTLSEASSAVGKTAQVGLGAGGGLAFNSAAASVHYDFGGSAPYGAALVATDAAGAQVGRWKMSGSMGDVQVGALPAGATLRVDSVFGNGQPDELSSGVAMLSQNMQVKGVAISAGAAYLVDPAGQRAAWSAVVGLN